MTFAGRSFNGVTDYVKKVEGVRRDGQAKAWAKWVKNSGSYSETPSHNFQDSQGVAPSTGGRPFFYRTCYNFGEPELMRRDYPHPHVFESAQQQTRAVVPTGNGNNGQGRPQGGQRGNQRGRGGRGNGNACTELKSEPQVTSNSFPTFLRLKVNCLVDCSVEIFDDQSVITLLKESNFSAVANEALQKKSVKSVV
uniref:'chromo' domain containing protein n=1 Tax=Solanum tuberosum TaxID=4113 RepID=M1D836_SOLTU